MCEIKMYRHINNKMEKHNRITKTLTNIKIENIETKCKLLNN